MKITFLGTSHGVPSRDRYCQSMLIEQGEAAYLVDAGAPVMDILTRRGFDLTRLKAVFITHMHGDHIHGLAELMDLASWYYEEMDLDVYMTEERLIESIGSLLSHYPNERVRPHCYGAGLIYEQDGLRVTAVPTTHLQKDDRPAYGFLLEAEDGRIYVSGDLNGELVDYAEDIANCPELDLFIVECAHFPAEVLAEKLKNCCAKRTAVVHVFPLDKYDVLAAARSGLKTALYLPQDGDTIEIKKDLRFS